MVDAGPVPFVVKVRAEDRDVVGWGQMRASRVHLRSCNVAAIGETDRCRDLFRAHMARSGTDAKAGRDSYYNHPWRAPRHRGARSVWEGEER